MSQQYQDYYRAKSAAWAEFMNSITPHLKAYQQNTRTEAHKLSDKGEKYFPQFQKNVMLEINKYIALCLPMYQRYLETYGAAFARDAMQQLAITIKDTWDLSFKKKEAPQKKAKSKRVKK